MRELKVLVACGGGIVTSTYVSSEIEEIARKVNVKAHVTKTQLMNLPAVAKDYDVVFVASKYHEDIGVPVYSATGVVTGINEEEERENIQKVLIALSQQQS